MIDCVLTDDETISHVGKILTKSPNCKSIYNTLRTLERIYTICNDSSGLSEKIKIYLETIKEYILTQFKYNLNFDVNQEINSRVISNLRLYISHIHVLFKIISIFKESIVIEKDESENMIDKFPKPLKRIYFDRCKINSRFNLQSFGFFKPKDLFKTSYSRDSSKEYKYNAENLKFIELILKGSNFNGSLQNFCEFMMNLINLNAVSRVQYYFDDGEEKFFSILPAIVIEQHFEKLGASYWFNTIFL